MRERRRQCARSDGDGELVLLKEWQLVMACCGEKCVVRRQNASANAGRARASLDAKHVGASRERDQHTDKAQCPARLTVRVPVKQSGGVIVVDAKPSRQLAGVRVAKRKRVTERELHCFFAIVPHNCQTTNRSSSSHVPRSVGDS